MNKVEKKKIIKKVDDIGKNSSGIFVIDFKNFSSPTIVNFRKELLPLEGRVLVVKNTLLKIAAQENTTIKKLEESFLNQVALVYSHDKDIFKITKALNNLLEDSNKKTSLKLGIIGNTLITEKKFSEIASISSVNNLYEKLLGLLKNSITILAIVLKKISEKNSKN